MALLNLATSQKVGDAYGKNTAHGERFLCIKKRKESRRMSAYEVIMVVIAIITLLKQKKD
ncbi:hypothetical protein MK528_10955 [Streptococcus gordonii]|uniref:hypothetical protein n=1 Tax=Streptococcus gordonii TaxID=1302 RepID=UPI000F667AF5|nr:hypothetical protein [Streptococcus gordonii]MCY7168876.1 hypothetical protein [Streptococcus gordonii]